MRITGLDIHEIAVDERQSWVFVQVHAGDGFSGLGELNPSAPRRACLGAVREIAEALRGRDPRQIAEISASIEPEKLDRPGVHAFSAVEQALWDILGKSLGKPVHALFGERLHREIPLYANITRGTRELTPQAFACSAAGAAADGFAAMKLAPFGGELMKRDRAAAVANGIECARAVREAIGPEADLMLDCYGIFSAGEALEIARGVADLGLFWLEEPVAEDDVEGYRRVRGETGLRLAGGERFMFCRGFLPALEAALFDVAMPDATVVGGAGELWEVAGMAAAQGIATAPHGPFGPVLTVVQAQVMAAQPSFLILEHAWGQVPWREDLVQPRETVRCGRLSLPGGPGYGIELNLEEVSARALRA